MKRLATVVLSVIVMVLALLAAPTLSGASQPALHVTVQRLDPFDVQTASQSPLPATTPQDREIGLIPGPWQAPKLNPDTGNQVLIAEGICDICEHHTAFMVGVIDPIYLHSGEFVLDEVDLRIPGRGFDYEFRRTYKSQIQYIGPLGVNWQHNYDQFLMQRGLTITVVNGLARADVYTSSDGINFNSPAGFYNRLTRNGDGTYTLRNAHGGQAVFNALDASPTRGTLASISDRDGNTMRFQYDTFGRLITVTDTLGRPITYAYNVDSYLDHIQDFTGRQVRFAYSNGDLISVTLPAVTGTPNGNDFPNGKTWRYTYSSGFGDARLNHNLISLIAPNEVADGSLTPRVVNTYGTTGYDFDRVIQQVWGGTNATTVPAGGTITLSYEQLNPGGDSNDLTLPRNRTTIMDRNGNQKVYEHNVNGQRLSLKEYSNRDVRPSDPAFWLTPYAYNRDGQRVAATNAEGNRIAGVYNLASADRLQQGNWLAQVRMADSTRGGDQAAITTTRTYEPIYNQVRTVTEPRGNDPSYMPQNGGVWSAARYTTIYAVDYEESCDFAAIGAKVGRTASEAQQLLSAAGMCAAPLGDINGDGMTNQVNGNVIRIQHPTVNLLPGSNQASVEGSISQPIVELFAYNQYGQLIRKQDPEGNVELREYYPSQDPNGDGVIDNPAGDPVTGGYLKQVTRDAVSAASRDSDTNPTPTNIRSLYRYDPVGNITRAVDGRGIATDYIVNQLNQVVQIVHAAAHDVYAPNPPEPVALTDFRYVERLFYDYNNNVVLRQVEDRGNTSGVDGSPYAYDLPSYIVDPDPLGGPAFVDTVYKYDILDQRIEMLEELSNGGSPYFLRTGYRYDPNGNQVLLVQPVGNAIAFVFDERDLLYQRTRGALAPPPLALLAGGDVNIYDVRGGLPSIATYHYDKNRNLSEVVDAADTDGSTANNSKLGGTGDRSRYLYDGFDRRTSVVDSVGNQTVYQYDPAGNLVRVAQFGPTGGASPTADGPDTLPLPVSSGGVIQSANLVNANLLAARANLYDELSRVIQVDRSLFVNTIATMRTPNVATGASDIGKGNLNPTGSCAVAGVAAPPSGYLGCVSTRSEYDRDSRPTFIVEDDGDSTRTFYDGADRVIKVVDAEGNVVETAYDDNHNIVETRETDVSQMAGVPNEVFLTTYFYDSLDRLQSRVDNLGQTYDYRYDSRNNLVAVADAQGPAGPAITRRAFTGGAGTGNTTNLFGNVVLYDYDGLSRKTRQEVVLTASGQGDGINIGATLEGIKTTRPTPDPLQGGGDGLIRTGYHWDDDSLLSSLADDQGNVTVYLYDNLNRRVVETKGLTVNTTPLNKAKILGARQVVAPTVATINNPAVIPTTTINTQLIAAKGKLNAVASLFPPLANRVDDNPPTTIVFGYDEDDNVLIMEDENDSETFTKYDALNRRLAVRVFRAGQSDSFSGDPLFAPAPLSDPSNPSATFPAVVGTNKQDYQHDGLSRLTRASDNNEPTDASDDSTIADAYDSLSRVVEETQQIGARPAKAISSAWRAENLRAALVYPNGRGIRQTFDKLDRLQSVADGLYNVYLPLIERATGTQAFQSPAPSASHVPHTPCGVSRVGRACGAPRTRPAACATRDVCDAGHVASSLNAIATYSYIGKSRIAQRSYANGVRLTYVDNAGSADVGYDSVRRPTQLRHLRADNSLVVGFAQSFDRMDDRLSESKLHNTANDETYQYDSAYRLLRFNRPNTGARAPLQSNWTLDGAGNWKQVDGEARQHSSFNEIVARGGTTILSDDNGNESDDGTHRFNWDYQNRLRTVTRKSDGALVATYSYDALDRRVRKVVTNVGALNGTTDFYLDGWREIEERAAADRLTQQYVYGVYLDEPLVLDRNLNGDDSAIGAGDQRLFYHENALHSVFALSDVTGKIVEGYQYDAYGRQTVFAPGSNGVVDFGADDVIAVGGASTLGNPFLFTARRLDPESNLVDYRARYLNPIAGRFNQRDPLGLWGLDNLNALNLYAYVRDNPTTYVDPTGLFEEGLWTSFAVDQKGKSDYTETKAQLRGVEDCVRRIHGAKAAEHVKKIGIGVATAPYKVWKMLSGKTIEEVAEEAAKKALDAVIDKAKEKLEEELKKKLRDLFDGGWECEQMSLYAEEGKNKCGCDVIFCYKEKTGEFRILIEGTIGAPTATPGKGICCPPLSHYVKSFQGTAKKAGDKLSDPYNFTYKK